MPYIKQEERQRLSDSEECIKTCGNLNYLITMHIRDYWTNSARNYQAINDIVGALEGAKTEFQRQIVNPYEDQKIKENGAIYE